MSSYNNDRPGGGGGDGGDQEPSSGALFNVNYKKHDDLKQMLDQSKDSLKLDAMKRIIGMIAKGKNASMLFPAVVKNVASKNIEVKKLVYVYLERYAEEQQDLALLSISTFQRGLKDPNQLIRASALRVLSSIRVTIIVPIMMLSIKDCANDMSPFVRKTAAHAIPKLYSLDPDQKENLIEIIEKLLNDQTTLVAGSVVMAFQEVCPERIDLIHRHFRKLCSLLVDVDEWGQIAILSMLTRYSRTQFLDPNKYDDDLDENDRPFYDDEEQDDEKKRKKPSYVMDHDHRLLLKSARPLLQSRNAAVVMAVSQLFYHLAPRHEVSIVAKALVRLLRGRREVQAIVLQNIVTMTLKGKGMFDPYLKTFYVRSTDPTHVRVLKLEVMTNLASETNISVILRELQTYVRSSDKQFVAHTIQAIARCATNIAEVTDTCLSGLVSLLSNRDEAVVAESVVVIKKLLQMNPSQHCDIIKHMARLIDHIQVAMARASILWLIGEYSEFVPMIAPDVLRKVAKTFVSQEDIVKLQIINLAAKLFVTNQKQTKLLTQYILQLAKYDQNYDIRDRARFIRLLIMPSGDGGVIHKHAKKILLAPKPAPVLESPFKGRDAYQLGSLSHAINAEASGYQKLPDFPQTQPDPSCRDVEVELPAATEKKKVARKSIKKKSFYSEEEDSSEEESSGTEDSESDSETSSDDDESSSTDTGGPDSDVSQSDTVQERQKNVKRPAIVMQQPKEESESENESESTSDSESSSDDDQSSSDEEPPPLHKTAKKKQPQVNLLDLDDFDASAPIRSSPSNVMTSILDSDLQGLSLNTNSSTPENTLPRSIQTYELLHRVTGEGLAVSYSYPRTSSVHGAKLTVINLHLTNNSDNPILNVHMGEKKLQAGLKVHDFPAIGVITPGVSLTTSISVDFCDTTQPLIFDLCTESRKFNVTVKVPVGELIKSVNIPQDDFIKQQGKLSGMNENQCRLKISLSPSETCSRITELVNVSRVPSTQPDIVRFAGKTSHAGSYLLLSVKLSDDDSTLCVNCDKMVICSIIFKQIKEALTK